MSRLVECTHCGAFVTEGAGHTLLDCVGHLRQVSRSIYAAGYTGVLQREITDLRASLDRALDSVRSWQKEARRYEEIDREHRDRARRVVRVFWRVRWDYRVGTVDVFGTKKSAYRIRDREERRAHCAHQNRNSGKVYRVVVRRVAKKVNHG